jgi:hypothetical protein
MDQKERSADHTAAMGVALAGWQRAIWTALPGIVTAYNASDNTVSVRPAINAVVLQQDPKSGIQTQVDTEITLLVKVPVVFPGGGGFCATFPIAAGDEVLVVFSARCIDAWWQSGGVQGQIEQRTHDLSDGMAIPGLRSVPRVPGSISATSAQLRSDDGACHIEMAPGHIINILAPGGINITGPLAVTGTITATQEITAKLGGASATVTQHKHGTGTAAAGTSVPTPGT